MTATVADFKIAFPEFASRDSAQLAATLARVELRVSSSLGDLRDEVVYLQLADTLAAGAQGRPSRKQRDASNAQTTYATKLQELLEFHALSRRISE